MDNRNKTSRINELEVWAWKNLKDSNDKTEWIKQIKGIAMAYFAVSEVTAMNYARIITLRKFIDLPEQKKSDFMLMQGYDVPAYTPKTLDEALVEERDKTKKIESYLISIRDREIKELSDADHMPDKEIIEEYK